MIIIGIDPGFITGFAVLVGGKLTECLQREAEEALEEFKRGAIPRYPDLVVIDAPQEKAVVWNHAPGVVKNAFLAGQFWGLAQAARCRVLLHPPGGKGRHQQKRMKPELWAAAFEWTGKIPGEHGRDAAWLSKWGYDQMKLQEVKQE